MTANPPDLQRLSVRERQAYVETIRIWYPRMRTIYEAIAQIHDFNALSAEPQCLMVVGPTGVGKSTLLRSYTTTHPREPRPEVDRLPILEVTVPARATIRNFVTRLLLAVGDPLADKGTVGAMENRLLRFMRQCEVEMLVVDDLQHFVDRDSDRVLHDISNWLKNLVKETHTACVMAGLPEAERVLNANSQLGRLFGDPHVLQPFTWDPARPETVAEFRRFLQTLEEMLPLPETMPLTAVEVTWRCYVASEGCMAYLMNLVRRAAQRAILLERPALDMTLLAEAFDHRLAGRRRGLTNPFVGDLPEPKGASWHG
jgi:energy-coupling factor transporter ATP-binding protein EcfA2